MQKGWRNGGIQRRQSRGGSALWGREGKEVKRVRTDPPYWMGVPLSASAISSGVQESAQAHNMLMVLSALLRII